MRSDHSTISTGEPAPPAGGSAALFSVLTAEQPLRQAASMRHLLDGIEEVEVRRGDRRRHDRSAGRLLLELADQRLSAPHARISRAGTRWLLEDVGSKNGVFINGVRVPRAVLADGDVLELGYSFFVFRASLSTAGNPAGDVGTATLPSRPPGLTTLNPALAALFEQLERVAASSVTIAVGGESGTGKELVARAVHQLSGRPGPFVAVNCAALPRTLLEAELFGFKKGSFSGAAHDKPGLIVSSGGGSLFLDEIGELSLEGQAALLRVLQEHEVLPIGALRPVPVDLRLIVATHRDLDAAVKQGAFRADLRARLGGFQLRLPPVRDRREDLGILLMTILARLAPDRTAMDLGHRGARSLFASTWPGNVRELERTVELAAVLALDDRIELTPSGVAASVAPPEWRRLRAIDRERRVELEALLRAHAGNVAAVARAMGKAREQVYRLIRRCGVDPGSYRR